MTCRTAWAGEQLHDIEAGTPWRQRVTRSARFRGGITRVQSDSTSNVTKPSTGSDQAQLSSRRANAHVISDLTFQNYRSVCVRKPRCSSRFRA